AGRVRGSAYERPAKLSVPAPTRAHIAKCAGTLHRAGAERIATVGRMGADNAAWIAQRSVRRTRSKSLDASLQRSAYLHPKDLWPGPALFLSAGAETAAGSRRGRAQSHAALHFAGIARHAGGTRERLLVPE